MSCGAKSLQEIEKQRGLAHPGLPYQYLESEITIDSVDQRGQRFPMSLAEEQETGIGRDSKCILPQPEMADELTLYRVFSIAPQWAPIRAILLQVERHRSKSRSGSGFQRIRGEESVAFWRMRKTFAVKGHWLGPDRPDDRIGWGQEGGHSRAREKPGWGGKAT